jgi:hypothetical protein
VGDGCLTVFGVGARVGGRVGGKVGGMVGGEATGLRVGGGVAGHNGREERHQMHVRHAGVGARPRFVVGAGAGDEGAKGLGVGTKGLGVGATGCGVGATDAGVGAGRGTGVGAGPWQTPVFVQIQSVNEVIRVYTP